MDTNKQRKRNKYSAILHAYDVQAITTNEVYLSERIHANTQPKAIFLFCQLYKNSDIKKIRARKVKVQLVNQLKINS